MSWDLYVITDRNLSRGRTPLRVAAEAISGGADIIQLREKECPGKEMFEGACGIRELTRDSGVTFIVNDRLDIALASGADGVHLGQEDLPLPVARRIVPEGFLIGVTVHTVDDAARAEREGADYVAVSPVYATRSKDDAGAPCGLAMVREVCVAVSVPVIGIGGITRDNAGGVIAAGADGVAVISAVVSADDIAGAARDFKNIIARAKEGRPAPGTRG
jgi:thiamine-phosphate pyrophosphorylase